eukprot:9431035-Prorocentrum_lima.AAC.1
MQPSSLEMVPRRSRAASRTGHSRIATRARGRAEAWALLDLHFATSARETSAAQAHTALKGRSSDSQGS